MTDSMRREGVAYYGTYMDQSRKAVIVDAGNSKAMMLSGWTMDENGVAFVGEHDRGWKKFIPWHHVVGILQELDEHSG